MFEYWVKKHGDSLLVRVQNNTIARDCLINQGVGYEVEVTEVFSELWHKQNGFEKIDEHYGKCFLALGVWSEELLVRQIYGNKINFTEYQDLGEQILRRG